MSLDSGRVTLVDVTEYTWQRACAELTITEIGERT